MMNKPWKLVLLLAGIFLAGGVTGALVAVKFGRNWVAPRNAPEQWAPMQLRRLVERLDLKPDQVEQIRPIIRRNMEELSRLRADSMSGTRTLFERMEREISAQLSPGQKIKFDEYNRQMRERMHKLMQKRPGGPGVSGDRHEGPRPPGGKP